MIFLNHLCEKPSFSHIRSPGWNGSGGVFGGMEAKFVGWFWFFQFFLLDCHQKKISFLAIENSSFFFGHRKSIHKNLPTFWAFFLPKAVFCLGWRQSNSSHRCAQHVGLQEGQHWKNVETWKTIRSGTKMGLFKKSQLIKKMHKHAGYIWL